MPLELTVTTQVANMKNAIHVTPEARRSPRVLVMRRRISYAVYTSYNHSAGK